MQSTSGQLMYWCPKQQINCNAGSTEGSMLHLLTVSRVRFGGTGCVLRHMPAAYLSADLICNQEAEGTAWLPVNLSREPAVTARPITAILQRPINDNSCVGDAL